ncbi:Alpha/Beta hydrolase protein [Crucibulum laeve]|uniref:Alpha/Beta hydrolase protein n=1 Tax=Crucibulum laeve TaxID=68775 RepID=A0A5C3LLM7_9AGAR|nr:Alpha/Beta hydrolase protein [Crucibulum laeve]
MPPTRPLHCLTLSLLLLPPLLLFSYLFTSFPALPNPVHIHHSLASLPKSAKTWEIYGEEYFEGGGYVKGVWGRTRYWLLGPPHGKKVVLIHGLSIPAIIWKDVAPALAKKGLRVLVYDLYGRGYSDAPQTTYDAALYTTQLALLMQHLRWDRASVVGVSMGGAIAASFTASFPHLVDDNVVLIASAGLMKTSDISRTAKFMSAPIVQTLAASVPFRKYLQHLSNSSSSVVAEAIPIEPHVADSGEDKQVPLDIKKKKDDPITEIVRLQSALLPGYNAALSSSLRDGPIRGQKASFESEGFVGKRVLILHGTQDPTVPPRYASLIRAALPPSTRVDARVVMIPGGLHDITISHASDVVREVGGWLRV